MTDKINEYSRLIWWIIGLLLSISSFLIASKLYTIDSTLGRISLKQTEILIELTQSKGDMEINAERISRNFIDIRKLKDAE
jgi:hypothetical protein